MIGNESIGTAPRRWLVVLICGSLITSGALMASTGKLEVNQAEALELKNQELPSLKTVSSFNSEIVEIESELPYPVEYVEDSEKDKCSEPEVVQSGVKGKEVKVIEVTYYDGEEYGKREIQSRRVEPEAEKIARGTKTVSKTLKTAEAEVTYTCHLGTFRATAYDPSCRGCSGTTAIGMKAGFGVVAVDPKVIPLGTKLYITGYGVAIAGDTGGSVKGQKIDLGFDKIDRSWGVRNVEVYVL